MERIYGFRSVRSESELPPGGYDAIVLAVAHREFAAMEIARFRRGEATVFDIKGVLPREIVDGRL